MEKDFQVIVRVGPPLTSPARVDPPTRGTFRIGAVQCSWSPDAEEMKAKISAGVKIAAEQGARLVCLQEITLIPYICTQKDALEKNESKKERIPEGPTSQLAIELAKKHQIYVHASLWERVEGQKLGFNIAICASPKGEIIARTRKNHIPITAGYYEDLYFRQGDSGFPVYEIEGVKFAFPTCWDEWFPELARIYSLAGADVIVYPTAIGSEPDHPGFDTEPLWEHVITANGIANGTFMVAPNRIGTEDMVTFYGSSFISDPYGRKLVQASRDKPAVLVADLDLDARRDWLTLFPFLTTRRPEIYSALTAPNPSTPAP